MTDADYLATYDPAAFPPVAVTTDVVLLTLAERALQVLLVARAEQPARGRLALPGSFVRADEELDRAARRALSDKAGVDAPVRQFRTFGAVGRDPRMRVVSVAYMALLPLEQVRPVLNERRRLVTLRDGVTRTNTGRRLALPFDHADIIAGALADLRSYLDATTWSFGMLPEEFPLLDLQYAHEAIRGEALNKPAFRKRMLDSGRLEPTGRFRTGTRARPAELYRLKPEHAREQ